MRETEDATGVILERMENSLCSMEQMAFDSINITDKLLMLMNTAREQVAMMAGESQSQREEAYAAVNATFDQLLETAFLVNNIAHGLDQESNYQRDTTEKISQIIDFLYGMADMGAEG